MSLIPADNSSAGPAPAADPANSKNETVAQRPQALIVDEDAQLLAQLDCWIAAAGYDVVTCSRFEDARRYLAKHAPAVLVADVHLGAFNGLQLVLVAKSESAAIGAIVLSRYEDPVLRREAAAQGAFYLLKPITREQLIECLNTLAPGVPATD